MSLMFRNPYDPFDEMDRMFNRMRAIMNSTYLPFDRETVQNPDANLLAVDVTSDDKNVLVRTAVPGFRQEDIKIDVQGSVLTISAETRTEQEDKQENWHVRELRYGKFARTLMLPEEVAADKADATLENGILTISLPKQKPNKVQQIAIKARSLLKSGK